MKLLMGIGNDLRGDDGVGVYVAREFKKICPAEWDVIVAGEVPEDFTLDIKKSRPELLVLVDAAIMGLKPGEIRRVPVKKISRVAFSTHGMPLSLFLDYIEEYVGSFVLIGVEPRSMEFGSAMSDEVVRAAHKLLEILASENLEGIPEL